MTRIKIVFLQKLQQNWSIRWSLQRRPFVNKTLMSVISSHDNQQKKKKKLITPRSPTKVGKMDSQLVDMMK